MEFLILAGTGFFTLLVIGLILARLYKRATKEMAFVRTGFGGQKVVMNGGAIVLPILHDTMPVNMNTMRIQVERKDHDALITGDSMRINVHADFFMRVAITAEAIANAAQTLGRRTLNPEMMRELLESKFVDALRSVAATMTMQDLHKHRTDFAEKVKTAVFHDIEKNGLELESVSLTNLDQTDRKYFKEDNAFDAEGLTKLTQQIEQRRKERNEVEQSTRIEIEQKNLTTEQSSFTIKRDQEFARLDNQREISMRTAEQQAEIAKTEADREREAEEARIAKDQAIEQAEVRRQQAIAISQQESQIAIANKSKEESQAKALADAARAEAVKAEESVTTARQTAAADRQKAIQLIAASEEAEKQAIGVTVQAKAEKQAAEDRSAAAIALANGEAQAETIRADAKAKTYTVDADGQRALNDAANQMSDAQIQMSVKMALIKVLPEVIRESVKPMERIDSIKIVDVAGIGNATGGAGLVSADGTPLSGGNLADQAVAAAMRYRAHSPVLDGVLAEVGFGTGESLNSMLGGVTASAGLTAPAKPAAPAASAAALPAPAAAAPHPAKSQEGRRTRRDDA